jgi:hypothetical protein
MRDALSLGIAGHSGVSARQLNSHVLVIIGYSARQGYC